MVLVKGELLLRYLPPLEHGAVLADLLQGQQVGAGFHHPAGDHNGGDVDAPNGHQLGRHGFVAAGDKHPGVKGGGVCVDFNQIGDGVPAHQGVVAAVVALAHAVAHVRGKVQRGFRPRRVGCLGRLLGKLQQVGAAGMALAVGALNEHLGLFQVLGGPAHAHAQGVHLRGQAPGLLAFQIHRNPSQRGQAPFQRMCVSFQLIIQYLGHPAQGAPQI